MTAKFKQVEGIPNQYMQDEPEGSYRRFAIYRELGDTRWNLIDVGPKGDDGVNFTSTRFDSLDAAIEEANTRLAEPPTLSLTLHDFETIRFALTLQASEACRKSCDRNRTEPEREGYRTLENSLTVARAKIIAIETALKTKEA